MSARAARADDDLSKTEKNAIEIIDTVEPGDRVLFNDRVHPLTVGRVSARRPTSKTVTVRLEGPQGGSYSLVHSQGGYGGESVNLRRDLGYNDEGRPVYDSMQLESIELVDHQEFRIGQVYETEEPIVGDEYYHVVTGVPDSGCYDVETVTIRVDDGKVADVKESGFFYSHDKPKIFDGGLDLVDKIGIGYSGDRGIYYDVEREEEIRLSGPHERGVDLRPTEGHGLEVVSWEEILLGFEDRFKKPMTDGGEPQETGSEQWDLEAFGREWSRMEHIFGLNWNQIFPHGKREMSPNGYMIRMVLDSQIPYGSSVWAEENLYWPAIDHAVAVGLVEMAEDENGDPVVRLPEGEEPYGIKGPSGGGVRA